MTESIEHNTSQNHDFTKYILWFVYACIIYSIIGFSWGAIMGGVPAFRHFVDYSAHGRLITLAHGHINLLGWVEMAIFAALYYVVPTVARRPIYSLRLVKIHFWMHNFGLIGMVVFFLVAGLLGGLALGKTQKEWSVICLPLSEYSEHWYWRQISSGDTILYRTAIGWQERR